MKSCLVFSFRERNSGTKIVKTVVTIGQEAVPIGDETVEQCTEQRPVCIACGFVGTASVPQSVPQGIPFKPLQGLAVPLFRHFRRMGGKICKNRKSAEYSKKELPRVPPHEPVSASMISVGLVTRRRREIRPQSPRRAPCAIRWGKGQSGIGCRESVRSIGGKHERFLSDLRGEVRKAGIRTVVGFAPAPVTSSRNGGLFWAFVRHPGRHLFRGRFGIVSPRFVLSPFLPISGGYA